MRNGLLTRFAEKTRLRRFLISPPDSSSDGQHESTLDPSRALPLTHVAERIVVRGRTVRRNLHTYSISLTQSAAIRMQLPRAFSSECGASHGNGNSESLRSKRTVRKKTVSIRARGRPYPICNSTVFKTLQRGLSALAQRTIVQFRRRPAATHATR